MGRIWSWYRARRWWTKALIAAPPALVSIALLFVLSRALQYSSASRVAAAEFEPPEAQLVVRATDAAGSWERIRAGELGKIVRTKMLRDPAVRKEVNALLESYGLPTLNDLEDRRFVERTNGMLTEEKILRFAGRDVMAAVGFGNTSADTRFCVATRLGFWDYVIAPFVPLALAKVDVKGTSCYRAGGLYVQVVGAVAVVSNSPDLIFSALRRSGRRGPSKKPVEATLVFERSAMLLGARRMIREFPAGALTLFADAESLSRIDLDLAADGPELVLEARLEGMTTPGAEAPAEAARYVPPMTEAAVDTSGAGAMLMNVGGDRLWEWARGLPQNGEAGAGEGLTREVVKMLIDSKFHERVVPQIRGPMSILLGSSLGMEQRTFASVALVLRSDDPAAAEQALRGMIQDRLKGARNLAGVKSEIVHGRTVGWVDLGADMFRDADYRHPCWAVNDRGLIVANNLDFLRAVVTTAAGGSEPMVDQSEYRSADERLGKLGLKGVLRDGGVASGFVWGQALREGLAGFWPIVAKDMTESSANVKKLRAEMETEWRKAGRNPAGKEFDDEVNAVMRQRVEEAAQSLRNRARVLDYLRWAAFEVAAEDDGFRLKTALELK